MVYEIERKPCVADARFLPRGLPVASLEAFEEKLAESVRVAIAESPRFWSGA